MSALVVQDLSITIRGMRLVDGVSFDVAPGECLAIVGESGAGKSLTASALLGLTPDAALVAADVLSVDGVDARDFSDSDWRELRGNRIGLVSQDALVSLDPLRRVGAEVAEPLAIHTRLSRRERRDRAVELLESVSMTDAARRAGQYPHELSGGLRQRALIASALAGGPAVLVADEPTTALDATVQARVLGLLRSIADAGTAVVFISHDIAAVRCVADRVMVMRAGRVIEQGAIADVLDAPQEEYTRELIAATRHEPRADRFGLGDAVLTGVEVSKAFSGIPAVDGASFTLLQGQTLGIVGESGSGKTTLARMFVGVEKPDSGELRWNGEHRVQLVHQNPLGAFDPRWTIDRSLREALEAGEVPRAARAARVAALMAEVGLDASLGRRRPAQLSGGQRQRAAIARALAADPDVLVLDEPVSALDPSVREKVLLLLGRLQRERDLTMIFVSHDLDVVAAVSDDVLVMQDGVIVEQGPVAAVFAAPQHPFTKELLTASAPTPR
ncbi:ABC transporter ATP-binding protein [Microbacterium sp. AK031]|uniref:dipeptide ABC transporter ATP-binding protein n=1 Tax=Microbacterium sp. AK031 TaxID=2723076 RepID=UPI002169D7A3|nr:ABC transporter ATP-binding protein [Microbacterium sp. AK031]MCS3843873.1 peptide/nickel transport system ATP-binding protein [Microbacterium sp. AK031]